MLFLEIFEISFSTLANFLIRGTKKLEHFRRLGIHRNNLNTPLALCITQAFDRSFNHRNLSWVRLNAIFLNAGCIDYFI